MQDVEIKRKKQRSDGLVPIYLRLPGDIKDALAKRSELEGISQAALVARILSDELNRPKTDERVGAWLARI
jgi:hypothetical protein